MDIDYWSSLQLL